MEDKNMEEKSIEKKRPWGMDLKTYCMLMHLSQLAGAIIPGAGLVLPIVMWLTNKDDFPVVDHHGRAILNWMLSLFIYLMVCIPLMFIFIGFFLFFGLLLLNLIFAILGAVKAYDEEVWAYPMCIRFFREYQ